MNFIFHNIWVVIRNPLTNSYFSEGQVYHQPVLLGSFLKWRYPTSWLDGLFHGESVYKWMIYNKGYPPFTETSQYEILTLIFQKGGNWCKLGGCLESGTPARCLLLSTTVKAPQNTSASAPRQLYEPQWQTASFQRQKRLELGFKFCVRSRDRLNQCASTSPIHTISYLFHCLIA